MWTICLLTSLSILSTTSTAKAEVRQLKMLSEPAQELLKQELQLEQWLLIEVATLKAIKKDADGYKLSLEKLNEAQEKQLQDVKEINDLQKEKHFLQRENYHLQVENYELKNPEWWESPFFWGGVGLAVGFVAGGIVVGYASGGL